MKLIHAQKLASDIIAKLRPYCEKIEVVGSVRRLKPEVKDIEVLVIPKQLPSQQALLGGPDMERHPGFANTIKKWKKVKGDPATGKYTQRIVEVNLPSVYEKSFKLDIFIANHDSWGPLMVIRTGSSDFNKRLMVHIDQIGWEQRDSYLFYNGQMKPCPTEELYFKMIGKEFIPPNRREK